MTAVAGQGRAAQRTRTRKAIVRAAARLLERGEKPGFDEIAVEAEVSRATAYRHFASLEALLSEAALDALVPEGEDLFAGEAPQDVRERISMVDDALDRACRMRETALRLMLARILERSALAGSAPGGDPLRQNRRIPMMREALSPLAGGIAPHRMERLLQAAAMIVGAEGFLALNDVVGLDAKRARDVRQWALAALLDATLAEEDQAPSRAT